MARRSPASLVLALLLALLCFVSLATAVTGDEQATVPDGGMTEEDLAAEEAAAAAVGEAAEEEEDDDADALDEEADSARIDSDRHPLSDMPPAAEDVLVAHTFIQGLDSTVVTLGETCKSLIAFANSGRGQYHVWGVMGSLNMEKNFNIYVQNFTYGVVNKTVGAGGELSFSYEFTPNERLDTRPFQMALSVFYEARGSTGNAIRGHSTTFYNATVATKPGPQSMSNGLFMLLFVILLGAAGGAYYVLRTTEAKKEAVEMGTGSSSANEWLEEHHNMVKTGGGRAKSRSAGRK